MQLQSRTKEKASQLEDKNKELQEIEEALRESEERFRATFEQLPVGIAHVNLEGGFLRLNQKFCQIVGYTVEEMLCLTLKEITHPDDLDVDLEYVRQLLAGEIQTYSMEKRYICKNASHVWVNLTVSLVSSPSGEPKYFIVVVQDISDTCGELRLRKEAEEALRESEERFRATFEQAAVGIAHVNLEGQFLRLNQKFCEIAGYTPEEMLSLTYQEITHPDDLDVNLEYARQLLAGEIQTYSMETRYIGKDSSQIWVNLTLSLVRSPSNEPKYFIAVVQDISDSLRDSCASRKQAQEILQRSEAQLRDKANQLEQALHELRHTQAQLVQSEKMYSLGLLVAGVAHEINNPVNFICGNLVHLQGYFKDLLELMQLYQVHLPNPVPEIQAAIQDKELGFLVEDIPSILSSMKVGTDRIRDIVFSLKSFSRTDEAEMKPVDIHEGIDTTLMILDHSLKVKAGRFAIKLIKNYGNLPLVECYPGQLNQVFMNLIKNAIDALDEYMPQPSLDGTKAKEGKIEIRTETLDSGRVAIRIIDNGPGISPEVQQRLFDPFFTTKVLGKGTGLGLTISQQIVVDKHQGQLRCFSTPGEGTEFAIELPIRQPKLQQ